MKLVDSKYFSVLIAQPKSTNIALAFANRAVVLSKAKEFKFAIEDINAAIDTGKYPQENLHKLYQRSAKSYECLQNFENAVNSYMKLLSSLKISKLTKAQKLQIKNETGSCCWQIVFDVLHIDKLNKQKGECCIF